MLLLWVSVSIFRSKVYNIISVTLKFVKSVVIARDIERVQRPVGEIWTCTFGKEAHLSQKIKIPANIQISRFLLQI